ncbi:hypothetical protein [Candidatus Methylobacter favarea]|nr:hypothetical protein [Candidatus Methylobacter favarea]
MPTKTFKTSKTFTPLLPRLIRIKDAPFYLGMDKNRFNQEVRPQLTEMKIGTQGIAFDRLDLDAWVDDLKSRSEQPDTHQLENIEWQKDHRDSPKGTNSGISTKSSKERDFTKALALAILKKPNAT